MFSIFTLFFFSCKNKDSSTFENNDKIIEDYKLKINQENLNSNVSLQYNLELLKLLSKSENNSKNRILLNDVSNNFFNLNDLGKYEKASRKLLEKAVDKKDTLYTAKALRYIGNCHYNKKILDSAFICYVNAEKLFLKIDKKEDYAIILLKKGNVQFDINDLLGAEISYSKSYNLLKENKDYDRIIGVLNSIGNLKFQLIEYGDAIDSYEKALQIIIQNPSDIKENQKNIILNNIGIVYNEKKNYKLAISYYEKALLDKKIEIDNPEFYSTLINNLAYAKMQLNTLTEPSLFVRALEIRKNLNYEAAIIASNNNLSEFYFRKKDTITALKYANEAIAVANKSKSPFNKVDALKQAAVIDTKNASKYSIEYLRLKDSLQVAERKNKDHFARILLETNEIIKEKEGLEQQNQIYLFYIIGLIVVFSTAYYVKNEKTKERVRVLEKAQQKANEEIYSLIIDQQNQINQGKDLEKKRISKELHDGILGRLFGARLSMEAVNSVENGDSKELRERCLYEIKIIEQDVREISHEMSRENIIIISNFIAVLNNLIIQQKTVGKANLDAAIEDIDWDIILSTIKIDLYRIIQESFQNINKYAKARNVFISITSKDAKYIVLKIKDDGEGFDLEAKKSGIGLKNMYDRASSCKGKLEIKSKLNVGTELSIKIPIVYAPVKIEPSPTKETKKTEELKEKVTNQETKELQENV